MLTKARGSREVRIIARIARAACAACVARSDLSVLLLESGLLKLSTFWLLFFQNLQPVFLDGQVVVLTVEVCWCMRDAPCR